MLNIRSLYEGDQIYINCLVVVEDATVKIGHNVRTTNKWVGFNPNNILNNTGL